MFTLTGPGKGRCWGKQLTTDSSAVCWYSRARWVPVLWTPRVSPIHCLRAGTFFFFFCCMVGGILVLRPGIEPEVPALNMQSLNHWTAPTLRLPDDHLTSDVLQGSRLVPSLVVSLVSSIPPDLPSEFNTYWLSNCMDARFSRCF